MALEFNLSFLYHYYALSLLKTPQKIRVFIKVTGTGYIMYI